MKAVYLVQQPKNLESLALQQLGKWIALQIEKLVPSIIAYHIAPDSLPDGRAHHIEVIRNVLESNVPRMLHNMLLIETKLALAELEARVVPLAQDRYNETYELVIDVLPHSEPMPQIVKDVIWQMIETLFTKHLTFLGLDGWTDKINKSLIRKLYLLTGLTHLDSCHDNQSSTIWMLKQLKNLRYLTLKSCYPNEILPCLVENCKLIEELNLSCSPITDENLYTVSKLCNLTKIDLRYTNVTERGIVKILMTCKNLGYIVIYSNAIADALKHIVSFEENRGIQFKLKSYANNGRHTTLAQLKLVVQTCPGIEDMTITRNCKVRSYLAALRALQKLQKLELKCYRFQTDKVNEILNARGCNLLHLELHGTKEINLNALVHIGQTCPKLQSLKIKGNIIIEHQKTSCDLSSLEMPLYKNLKELVFDIDEIDIIRGYKQIILFLLSNSPKIEFINTAVELTDSIMLEVLDKNPLVCLKKLEMCNSRLSQSVIEQIVKRSNNFLEVKNHSNFFEIPTTDGAIDDCVDRDDLDYVFDDYDSFD